MVKTKLKQKVIYPTSDFFLFLRACKDKETSFEVNDGGFIWEVLIKHNHQIGFITFNKFKEIGEYTVRKNVPEKGLDKLKQLIQDWKNSF